MTLGVAAKSTSRVELNSKKPPSDGVPDKVDTALQSMFTDGLGDVVAELPLILIGLLRDVGVGAEGGAGRSQAER